MCCMLEFSDSKHFTCFNLSLAAEELCGLVLQRALGLCGGLKGRIFRPQKVYQPLLITDLLINYKLIIKMVEERERERILKALRIFVLDIKALRVQQLWPAPPLSLPSES